MKYLYSIDQKITQELDQYITAAGLREIYRLAITQYPNECCGLILQQGIRPCPNIQNQLHQADPLNYPRTATSAFTFAAIDALFLSRNINSDNPVKIIYHSHPDVGAYFSHTDKINALYEGQPIYPVDHLVIDVQSNNVICAKIFRFIEPEYTLIAILPGSNDQIFWWS